MESDKLKEDNDSKDYPFSAYKDLSINMQKVRNGSFTDNFAYFPSRHLLAQS